MKKQLAAILALIIMSTLGCVTVSAALLPSESWVSADGSLPETALFETYMGNEFDKDNFFIWQFVPNTVLEPELGLDLDDVRSWPLYIEVSTNSQQPLDFVIGVLFGAATVEGVEYSEEFLALDGYTNRPSDNEKFTISKDASKEMRYFEVDGLYAQSNEGIFGLQLLNPENLTAETTVTVKFTAKFKENTQKLGEVTYTYFDWTTDKDAGFYLDGETKYGMMRFLFDVKPNGTIQEVGIKYINAQNIGTGVTSSSAGGATITKTGDIKAFYGDIVGIPDTVTEGTYYAAAYVKTENGIVWSDIVDCSINWTQQFTDYQPAAAGGAE